MNTLYSSPITNTVALEHAAKYICNSKCGLCPMVTEGFHCLKECDLETKAWQCWVNYFQEKSIKLNKEGFNKKQNGN